MILIKKIVKDTIEQWKWATIWHNAALPDCMLIVFEFGNIRLIQSNLQGALRHDTEMFSIKMALECPLPSKERISSFPAPLDQCKQMC